MSASLANFLPPSQPRVAASQKLLKPRTNPIPLLSDQRAKQYSRYAHTVLVLLYYYVRSGALVREPLETMMQDLPVVGLLQCIFCALCLPSAGNWVSGTGAGKIIEGSATMSSSSGSSMGKGSGSISGSLRKRVGNKNIGGAAGKSAGASSSGDADVATVTDGGRWQTRIMVSFRL